MGNPCHCFCSEMAYKAIFVAFSWAWIFLRPVINLILPLNNEIVIVNNITNKVDFKNQYPVLGFMGLVQQHGYTAEEYVVQTSDGYNLMLHRISGGPMNPPDSGKPVAYMQHGMLQASDSFVIIGPDHDLAFQLVNAGYDVWLGNFRGNIYSRSHISKNPKKEDFWDFSHYDLARYDLPALIDRVLNETQSKSLTYYGFSLGSTISYAMLSILPEYNDKINMVYSLAPAAFWKHKLRPVAFGIITGIKFIEEYFDYFGISEMFPSSALAGYVGKKYCVENNVLLGSICGFVTCKFFSMDYSRLNATALPSILEHTPSGTSKWILYNYYQNYAKGEFQGYDYGKDKNMKKYGQPVPPIYNLTKITAPVTLWYGKGDDLVNPDDALDLAKNLPNLVSVNAASHDKFNHIDFLWAVDAKKLVYDHIIKK